VAAVFVGAIAGLAGCRHHNAGGTLPSNYQPPKDSSEATARKILIPGTSSGLTSEAKKIEQSLGYR
jgi:hypothetical protein